MQSKIPQELHVAHLGIVKMKGLEISYTVIGRVSRVRYWKCSKTCKQLCMKQNKTPVKVKVKYVLIFTGFFASLLLNVGGEKHIFPINNELTFLWNASFTVGSSMPVKLISKFNLNAELIIQTWKNGTTFEVSKLLQTWNIKL